MYNNYSSSNNNLWDVTFSRVAGKSKVSRELPQYKDHLILWKIIGYFCQRMWREISIKTSNWKQKFRFAAVDNYQLQCFFIH